MNSLNAFDILDSFQKSIKEIKKINPYIAFQVISIAFEFLGKCISNEQKWATTGLSRKDFNNALDSFDSLKFYSQISNDPNKKIDLYKEFRCSLVHESSIGDNIFLKDEGENKKTETNDKVEISLSCLISDFESAISELKEMEKKGIITKNLRDSQISVWDKDGVSLSGKC